MSTAQEIENAIRSLSPAERDLLVAHLPNILPEFAGDSDWERLINDTHARPLLSKLLDETEAELARNPAAFPEMTVQDFGSPV